MNKEIKNPVLSAILLRWPLGNIYQGFRENVDLYMKAIGSRGHNGIDIVGKQGVPLLATAGEIVEVKDTPTGYGKHIRIITPPDENGDFLELVYGHCNWILVKIGDKVENGQQIAGMSNTGFIISNSTPYWGNAPAGVGVHLHFGVRKCSLYADKAPTPTTYSSGKKVFVYDYNNGLFGYLDPLKFIEAEGRTFVALTGLIQSLKMKILELLKGRQNEN